MESRKTVLTKLVNQASILAKVLDLSADFSKIADSEELRISIANDLETTEIEVAKSRAAFIRKQTGDNFDLNRES